MLSDPALCQRLLSIALERGGEYADLYSQRTRSHSLSFEEGKVKQASESLQQGVGIRVQHGEATGYAVCEDLDPAQLMLAAKRAATIAAGGGASPVANMSEHALPARYTQRRPLDGGALVERIAYVRRASDHAQAKDPRVQWASAGLSDRLDEIIIATSDGVFVRDLRPHVSLYLSLTGAIGERRESAFHGFGGRYGLEYLEHHRAEDLAEETLRRLDVALRTIDAPAGTMPVVIAAGEGGVMLHEAVGHGLEADFNRKGVSSYSGKVGEMVASPLVTLFDRGDVVGDSGSLNVDDEGVVPGHTTLIDQGRLTGYLTDRLSSRLMGVAGTGNGRRQDYRHVPQPRMRVTGLMPGTENPQDLLSGISHGLYVTAIGGGSVDITKGDFNFQVQEAYLIEEGRIGAPVRGACLIGNGPEVMRRISRLGNDLVLMETLGHCGKMGQSVPVGFGCPTMLISDMVVGGSKT